MGVLTHTCNVDGEFEISLCNGCCALLHICGVGGEFKISLCNGCCVLLHICGVGGEFATSSHHAVMMMDLLLYCYLELPVASHLQT